MKLWGIDKRNIKLESTEVETETTKSYFHERKSWLDYRSRTSKSHKDIHLTAKDAINSFSLRQTQLITQLEDRIENEINILIKIKELKNE